MPWTKVSAPATRPLAAIAALNTLMRRAQKARRVRTIEITGGAELLDPAAFAAAIMANIDAAERRYGYSVGERSSEILAKNIGNKTDLHDESAEDVSLRFANGSTLARSLNTFRQARTNTRQLVDRVSRIHEATSFCAGRGCGRARMCGSARLRRLLTTVGGTTDSQARSSFRARVVGAGSGMLRAAATRHASARVKATVKEQNIRADLLSAAIGQHVNVKFTR